MKKLVSFLMLALILSCILLPCAAEPALPRLVDEANLLSEAEYDALLAELDKISAYHQCDVVLVTLSTLNGHDITAYADNFFDENGFGQGSDGDGILFLISMTEREWAISTCGIAINIFTDQRQAAIMDAILDDLSAGRYGDAFSTFAAECEDYLYLGILDEYPMHSSPSADYPLYAEEEKISIPSVIGISLVIGLIAAIIYTAILKGQLKSVAPSKSAQNYICADSFKLTDSRDVFLYRNVTRRPRQQNNSSHGGGGSTTHRASSGRSHGGSRGRF